MLPQTGNIDEKVCQSLLKPVDVIVRENDDIEKKIDIVDK